MPYYMILPKSSKKAVRVLKRKKSPGTPKGYNETVEVHTKRVVCSLLNDWQVPAKLRPIAFRYKKCFTSVRGGHAYKYPELE